MTGPLGDGAERSSAPITRPSHGGRNLDHRRILSSLGHVIYEWDCYSDALVWGPGAEDVLGLPAGTLPDTGATWLRQLGSDQAPPWLGAAPGGGRYQRRYLLTPQACGQESVWIEDHGRWFPGPDGQPARAHGSVRVSGDGRQTPDSAPGPDQPEARVLSRQEFEDHAGLLLGASRHAEGRLACLLIAPWLVFDADGARAREVADELMAGMAARVKGRMRRGDVIARMSHDALGILLEACTPRQARVATARFADAVMSAPIETSAGPLCVRLQAGASVGGPGGEADVDALFERAQAGLDHARADASLPQFVLGARTAPQASPGARRMSETVRDALVEGRVLLALQPIVSAATGRPAFWEALARVERRDGALLNPGDFVPAIEETGLVVDLDQRVLELALNVLEAEPAHRISVNVSGATLHDPGWIARVEATLADRMHCAPRLTFEITETMAIRDLDATARDIARLHGLGCRVAMDDFGAGHTSFRVLRALDVDVVKIDGAFVKDMLRSPDDQMFVRTLQALAKHLGVLTVAEWVECAQTARLLASWGVDYLQGVHFGRAELCARSKTKGRRAA